MSRPHTPPQLGPPLLAPAAVALVLTVASLVLFSSGPRPGTGPGATLEYLQTHDTRVHVVAFLVFGTAFPLAVWAATIYRRLRRLGVTAPGAAIALVGGTLAAASLALSGLVTWVAADTAPDLTGPTARILLDLTFATGGAGFAVPLGLLIAGVAVPVVVLRLAPRALGWIGLVLGGIGVLSSLTLLVDALDPLLPVTRFGGLVWLVAVSVALPRTRHESGSGASTVASDRIPA